MMDLDDTDRGIMYILQHDSRRITTDEMGERVGVSASTVRNRIEKLEEEGIIRGYYPDINYDKAGLQFHVEIICSAPNPKREQIVEDARNVSGVIELREVLNGKENVQIDAVGTDSHDVARITDELSKIGLEVVNTKIIKEKYMQPFNHFGATVVQGQSPE